MAIVLTLRTLELLNLVKVLDALEATEECVKVDAAYDEEAEVELEMIDERQEGASIPCLARARFEIRVGGELAVVGGRV